MSQEIDLKLINLIRSGDHHWALSQLVEKYLPMVHFIVKRQNPPSREVDDFVQEGALGLLNAIQQYKGDEYPIKFSTFAYTCILRRIYSKIKQNYTKKALLFSNAFSLSSPFPGGSRQTLLAIISGDEEDPFIYVEQKWVREQLNAVLTSYLSSLEFKVTHLLLNGYTLGEMEKVLKLPVKVIDNARTRARIKLKKLITKYDSLVSPDIPLKVKKCKTSMMSLKVV